MSNEVLFMAAIMVINSVTVAGLFVILDRIQHKRIDDLRDRINSLK